MLKQKGLKLYILFLLLCSLLCGIPNVYGGAANLHSAEEALKYVSQINSSNCTAGTGNVLQLQFDVKAWNQYTDPAIRTANLLSKVLELNNGTLDSLSDEIFFQLVRNNVHGDSLIFGSAIAIEKGVYRKDNASLPSVEEVYPIAKLADGHWTNPYYDCGGGNIWMVTYSSPIFRLQNGIISFRGVATIDIELTHIDINQCDSNDTMFSSGLDVFRGTHKCQPTTACVFVGKKGFVTGAYDCICENGFYSSNVTSNRHGYNGEEIETYFRNIGRIDKGMFQCAACAAGCDTCVDASPCLHQRNEPLMITLTFLNFLTVVGIIAIAIATYIYRTEMVIKSASPIFLKLMCLGGLLTCVQCFLYYPEASVIICCIRIWPLHVGFYILYGSLILKTWRISMIFSVGKQKRIRLTDQVLLQRFALLLLLIAAALSAWNASRPPKVETLKTSSNLKFYSCNFGPWEYALMAVEIVFLLYGVYLCYTVRKAPAYFNESKLITWAVYNAIILGSFMSFMSKLLITVLGPDLVTVFQFAQIQIYTTVTLLIIFVPKFLAIKKKLKIEAYNQGSQGTKQTSVTVTGRVRSQGSTVPAVVKVYASTQTEWEC